MCRSIRNIRMNLQGFFIVADSHPCVLIAGSENVLEVIEYPVKAVFVDIEYDDWVLEGDPVQDHGEHIDRRDLAYVIYTLRQYGTSEGGHGGAPGIGQYHLIATG